MQDYSGIKQVTLRGGQIYYRMTSGTVISFKDISHVKNHTRHFNTWLVLVMVLHDLQVAPNNTNSVQNTLENI